MAKKKPYNPPEPYRNDRVVKESISAAEKERQVKIAEEWFNGLMKSFCDYCQKKEGCTRENIPIEPWDIVEEAEEHTYIPYRRILNVNFVGCKMKELSFEYHPDVVNIDVQSLVGKKYEELLVLKNHCESVMYGYPEDSSVRRLYPVNEKDSEECELCWSVGGKQDTYNCKFGDYCRDEMILQPTDIDIEKGDVEDLLI